MNRKVEMVCLAALIHDIHLLDGKGSKSAAEWRSTIASLIAEKTEGEVPCGELLRVVDNMGEGATDPMSGVLTEASNISLRGIMADDRAKSKPRLRSIFDMVGESPQGKHYYRPGCNGFGEQCYPTTDAPAHTADLLSPLVEEMKGMPCASPRHVADTLTSLLSVYAATVPCVEQGETHISLYDHLRTTAALATSLLAVADGVGERLLLVGGDLSGIQAYIYQIVSKHAAKNLKGRSFYIRLVSDAIVHTLLNELRLTAANVIYNSGGCFYLLAPNSAETVKILDATSQRIERAFFRTHGVTLNMSIGYVPFSTDVLKSRDGQLRDLWTRLFEIRDAKKRHKFSAIVSEEYEQLFCASTSVALQRDSITGEPIPENEKAVSKGGLVLRPINQLQIEIGKWLKETECMVITDSPIEAVTDEMLRVCPLGLGVNYYLCRQRKDLMRLLSKHSEGGEIRTFNSATVVQQPALPGFGYSVSCYGGNATGYHGSDLSQMIDEEEGLSRLGVLRMDVDNLGRLFQRGLPDSINSLSAMATLSRSLDHFFGGCLNEIWRRVEPDGSYIVYSGGDDLFLVGNWSACICLAKTIREHFERYVGSNTEIGLSGGIAFVGAKFPIMKGAELSEQEERRAKEHRCGQRAKDSLSFLAMPLSWKEEFPQVEELKEQLVELIDVGRIDRSILGKVMRHYANAEIKRHQVTRLKTHWMMAYDLSRMKETPSVKKDAEVRGLIDTCVLECTSASAGTLGGRKISTEYHPLELWALAARWAEFETREIKVKYN